MKSNKELKKRGVCVCERERERAEFERELGREL